jgi:hypothetical protein
VEMAMTRLEILTLLRPLEALLDEGKAEKAKEANKFPRRKRRGIKGQGQGHETPQGAGN